MISKNVLIEKLIGFNAFNQLVCNEIEHIETLVLSDKKGVLLARQIDFVNKTVRDVKRLNEIARQIYYYVSEIFKKLLHDYITVLESMINTIVKILNTLQTLLTALQTIIISYSLQTVVMNYTGGNIDEILKNLRSYKSVLKKVFDETNNVNFILRKGASNGA